MTCKCSTVFPESLDSAHCVQKGKLKSSDTYLCFRWWGGGLLHVVTSIGYPSLKGDKVPPISTREKEREREGGTKKCVCIGYSLNALLSTDQMPLPNVLIPHRIGMEQFLELFGNEGVDDHLLQSHVSAQSFHRLPHGLTLLSKVCLHVCQLHAASGRYTCTCTCIYTCIYMYM